MCILKSITGKPVFLWFYYTSVEGSKTWLEQFNWLWSGGKKNPPKTALGFAVLSFKEQDKLSDQFFPIPAKILLNETEKFVTFKRKFVPRLLQV